MVYKIEFYAYALYLNIFFILNEGRIRIRFSAEPDPNPRGKKSDPQDIVTMIQTGLESVFTEVEPASSSPPRRSKLWP